MVRALQILFPLYIYPLNCHISRSVCAWKPLYDALDAYPGIQFTLIIDPSDGPGPANTLPGTEYTAAITAVNAYANVKTIGYVASNKTNRPAAQYQADVNTYLYWGAQNANLSMHGIFIDEAINTQAALPYYSTFSQYVRNQTWPGGAAPLVVQNQGAVVPQNFFDTLPLDFFVTFENFYYKYKNNEPWTIWTDPYYASTPRNRQAVIFHDFTGNTTDLVGITDASGETQGFKYIYVTTQPDYNHWSTMWSTFVAAVNGTNTWMAQHPGSYPRKS